MNEWIECLLRPLSEFSATSGDEAKLSQWILPWIDEFVDTAKIDRIGNLVATVGNGGKLVISAHMDEVAFMVTGISEDGTLRFYQVGGVLPSHLPSKRVLVGERKIPGVIAAKPVHLTKDKKKNLGYDDLYLFIGCQNKTEAEAIVSVGDLIYFDTPFIETAHGSYFGKAFDNRLGCLLLIRLIRDRVLKDATFVFSVQEENGLRGMTALLEEKEFLYGIALDTTTANDLPGVSGFDRICSLGKGPVISFMDGATVYDQDLIRSIFSYLQGKGIPIQTKSKRTGGNEGSAIQKSFYGAKAVSLSVPCRYIHSPVGIVLDEDIESSYLALTNVASLLGGDHNA